LNTLILWVRGDRVGKLKLSGLDYLDQIIWNIFPILLIC
jgi:hypothetical protein